ncbi:hypothetical protein Cgig2_032124 [Carnegiea gigantea]|uniref:Uncharacterized protein n=1 Tax=Carnegiea gigantea TaxID=171969 RepID=A0A9Q1JSS7_9CARY|nr:hypothetical protein Cgig2_032124 [Carnegiea gigantea]
MAEQEKEEEKKQEQQPNGNRKATKRAETTEEEEGKKNSQQRRKRNGDSYLEICDFILHRPPPSLLFGNHGRFPFVASEVFTCEIDVILRTLVDEEELMNLLFSFLEPGRPHSTLLAGYFSKVVVCLMLRKTVPLMNYVQAHQIVLQQLIDLMGITSIMEVLVRLVGADDHVYPNYIDVLRWLADSNVLEMIIDKLSPTVGLNTERL